jgi:hypothetical protein
MSAISHPGLLHVDDVYCRSCGYSLRGLPRARCPECGCGFDLTKPKTVERKRGGAVARWAQSSIGLPMFLLTLTAVLLTLWAASVPMTALNPAPAWLALHEQRFRLIRWLYDQPAYTIRDCVWVYAWALLAGVAAVRMVMRIAVVLIFRVRSSRLIGDGRRWLLLLALAAMTHWACRTNMPLRLGILLSGNPLADIASPSVFRGPPIVASHAGIYPILNSRPLPILPGNTPLDDLACVWVSPDAGFCRSDDPLVNEVILPYSPFARIRFQRVGRDLFAFKVFDWGTPEVQTPPPPIVAPSDSGEGILLPTDDN